MIKLKNILLISSALWVNIEVAHAKVSDTSCPSVETVKAAIKAQRANLNSTTGVLTMEGQPWSFEYKTAWNLPNFMYIFQENQPQPACQLSFISSARPCLYWIGAPNPKYNVNMQCSGVVWASITLKNIS